MVRAAPRPRGNGPRPSRRWLAKLWTGAVGVALWGGLHAGALLAQSGVYDLLAKEILAELVSIRSSAPYPGNTIRLLEGVAARLRGEGFSDQQIHIVPAGEVTNLILRYPGGGQRRPLLTMAHVDVVDADPSAWRADPFTLAEIDGYYYGRGTDDNKAGAATLITNFIRLKREGYLPDRDLIMLLTGDEESSMSGVAHVSSQKRDLIDAEFALNTDAGGVGIDDQGKAVASVQMSEKLYQTFEIETTNRGGHSSQPRPDNAIYQLAAALLRIQHYRFPVRINKVVGAYMQTRAEIAGGEKARLRRRAVGDPPDPEAVRKLAAEDPFLNASIRTTCVATMLESGVAENALPRSAKATVNCRILPGISPRQVMATLAEIIADDTITIRALEGGSAPSPPSPLREDVLSAIRGIGSEYWGPIPFVPYQSPGATDGLWIRKAGIPVYGFSGLSVEINDVRAHGLDERLKIDSFHTGVRYWYRLLKALSGSPDLASRVRR